MKLLSFLASIIVVIGVFCSIVVFAQVSVGVNEGDWIEYDVVYSGSPPDSYPKWMRIEVTDVQGLNVSLDLTVERLNGTSDTLNGTFNIATGVADLLFIPANLEVGEEFYHEEFGNIEIRGTEEQTYAEANRVTNYATLEDLVVHWDRSSGILVEADQTAEYFTQKLVVDRTNVWHSQIFGLDLTLFFVLIGVSCIVIALVGVLLLRRR